MGIVIGVFVLTLALVFGAYWLFVEEPEIKEERSLRRRLAPERSAIVRPALVADHRLSSVGWLNTVLTHSGGIATRLQRLIGRAALRVSPGVVLLGCIFAALVTFTAVGYATQLQWLAALAGIFVAPLPLWYVRLRANRRMAKFEEQFPPAIDLVSRALRAGHALTTALEMVADEVADPVGTEFRLLFERQNFGMSLEQALRGFAERIPLVDVRFFVTAILTQREVGGNLSEVLDNLSAVIRERFTVKREIRIASAHGRITGWVLAAMPPVVALLLVVIQRDHIRLLIDDPLGVQMIVGAIVLQLIGLFFMRKIINVEF